MDLNQKDYIISEDMNYPTFPVDLTQEGSIKRELKDDEDMMLFAQLDNLANNMNNSSEYQIVQEVAMMNGIKDPVMGAAGVDGDKVAFSMSFPNDENTSHYIRYKLVDGKHVKVWECGICGKEFTHQYTLMRHLPTHTDERKFQCNTCGKAFRQMSTLSQHRAIHSTERPYMCEICNKTFNRVSTLISHRKTHTGDKPHRCHFCNKSFHQKGNLRNHIFTHTNERPYKCDICEKGFNQMSNLMCHKMKAHQRTEAPRHICQVCGKHFPKRIDLRQHEQYTHGMINPPSHNVPDIPETNSMEAILVDPIKTEAMRLTLEANQTPFALLRPVCGIPVLVRVLPAGDKQMLVPATADDLKKHANISITPKIENESQEESNGKKNLGSTVQLKIPVVATVIQQRVQGGELSMAVCNPGPNGEYQSSVEGGDYNSSVGPGGMVDIESMTFTESFPAKNVDIQCFNEHGMKSNEKDIPGKIKVNSNINFDMDGSSTRIPEPVREDRFLIDNIHIIEKRPMPSLEPEIVDMSL